MSSPISQAFSIRKCLNTGRKKALEKSSSARCKSVPISRLIPLHQLALLDGLSRSTIGKQKLEDPRLVFDRLLLKHSLPYRRTRKMASALGAVLLPKMMTKKASIRAWDPGRKEVFFSPVVPELRELLLEDDFSGRSWKTLERIKDRYRSAYHDLNHYIAFSLLRPAPSRIAPRTETTRYYRLVESLVRMRDLEFAENLGDAGAPLSAAGVLECALSESEIGPEKPWARFESFAAMLTYLYFQRLGYSRSEIHAEFRKARRKIPEYPLRGVSEAALNGNIQLWAREYRRKFGDRLRFPPTKTNLRLERCEVALASPRGFLEDPELLRGLHHWYRAIFE